MVSSGGSSASLTSTNSYVPPPVRDRTRDAEDPVLQRLLKGIVPVFRNGIQVGTTYSFPENSLGSIQQIVENPDYQLVIEKDFRIPDENEGIWNRLSLVALQNAEIKSLDALKARARHWEHYENNPTALDYLYEEYLETEKDLEDMDFKILHPWKERKMWKEGRDLELGMWGKWLLKLDYDSFIRENGKTRNHYAAFRKGVSFQDRWAPFYPKDGAYISKKVHGQLLFHGFPFNGSILYRKIPRKDKSLKLIRKYVLRVLKRANLPQSLKRKFYKLLIQGFDEEEGGLVSDETKILLKNGQLVGLKSLLLQLLHFHFNHPINNDIDISQRLTQLISHCFPYKPRRAFKLFKHNVNENERNMLLLRNEYIRELSYLDHESAEELLNCIAVFYSCFRFRDKYYSAGNVACNMGFLVSETGRQYYSIGQSTPHTPYANVQNIPLPHWMFDAFLGENWRKILFGPDNYSADHKFGLTLNNRLSAIRPMERKGQQQEEYLTIYEAELQR
jgi:hypothetical protein